MLEFRYLLFRFGGDGFLTLPARDHRSKTEIIDSGHVVNNNNNNNNQTKISHWTTMTYWGPSTDDVPILTTLAGNINRLCTTTVAGTPLSVHKLDLLKVPRECRNSARPIAKTGSGEKKHRLRHVVGCCYSYVNTDFSGAQRCFFPLRFCSRHTRTAVRVIRTYPGCSTPLECVFN